MASQKYTAEQIIAALRATKGMVYVAARSLGCSPNTIRSYARRYATVAEALADERGLLLDTAELALVKAIHEGQGWAVCFILKTLGKDRGYVERQEVSGPEGGPISLVGSSEWVRIRTVLVHALAPYPEARAVAGAALAEVDGGGSR